MIEPFLGDVLSELVSGIVTNGAGRGWRMLRGRTDPDDLSRVVSAALRKAILRARLADQEWSDEQLRGTADLLTAAFTPKVVQALLTSLDEQAASAPSREMLAEALAESGRDLDALDEVLRVDVFLRALPEELRDELGQVAFENAPLWGQAVLTEVRRIVAAGARDAVRVLSPDELRRSVATLLRRIDDDARKQGMPRYLPAQTDAVRMNRMVSVRPGLRHFSPEQAEQAGGAGSEDGTGSAARAGSGEGFGERAGTRAGSRERAGHVYWQPSADRAAVVEEIEPQPWTTFVAENPRVVVLADPGMGKSWLVRTECSRLAGAALKSLLSGASPENLVIPVRARCDELLAVEADSLGDAFARLFVTRWMVPQATADWLAGQIDAGQATVLLDALDELPDGAQRARLGDLLNRWLDGCPGPAKLLITSRIAGYAGPPLPPASGLVEAELRPFERADIEAVADSWGLSEVAVTRLRSRLQDPAVLGMARTPLLLALLCATAADAGPLPSTRWQLYERVVRHFLALDRRAPALGGRDGEQIDLPLGLIGPIALHFANRPDGWVDLMPADEIREVLRGNPDLAAVHGDVYKALKLLAVDAGLLTPAGSQVDGRNPPYLFVHRTVAEYLVARELAIRSPESWREVLEDHLWFDPEWTEVIPMLGGQLQQPGPLLDYLLGLDDDPCLLGLFTAARIVGELPAAVQKRVEPQLAALADRLAALGEFPDVAREAGEALQALPARYAAAAITRLTKTTPYEWQEMLWAIASDADGAPVRQTLVAQLAVRSYDRHRLMETVAGAARQPDIRDALLLRLDDTDPAIRRLAARAVADLDDEIVVRALLARFEIEDDGQVQDALAGALTGSAHRTEVWRVLLQVSRRRSSYTLAREARPALERAATLGGAAPALIELLRDVGAPTAARRLAANALSAVASADIRADLLTLLEDPDESVRHHAADALASAVDDPVVRATFCRLVEADDSELRGVAIRALGGALEFDEVREVVRDLHRDQDAAVRLGFVEMSEDLALYDDLLPGCLALLDGHHQAIQEAAVRVLVKAPGGADVRDRLLRWVRANPGSELTWMVLTQLREVSGVVELMEAGFPARMYWTKRPMEEVLAPFVHHPRARSALLRTATGHSRSLVREAAIRALAWVAADEAVRERLVDLLVWGRANYSAEEAAKALTSVADHPAVFRPLLALAVAGGRSERSGAITALTSAPRASGLAGTRLSAAFTELRELDPDTLEAAYPVLSRLAERGYRELPVELRREFHAFLAAVTKLVSSRRRYAD